jgi:pimeloyl-ACP methyl ester carboxylesterase
MLEPVAIEHLGIDADGGRLAAFRLGSPVAGAPVVVAVHGITATSRAWLPVARALSGRAAIVALDLRGRGASNALPPPYGTAAHVSDVLAVLDHLELERAVIAGHSLGAYVVARLAAEHPDRVRTAVLVDGGLTLPGSEGMDRHAFADAFLGPALARLKLTFSSPEEYCAWWRRHPAFSGDDVADDDLAAYAAHDLTGEPPQLRPSASEPAVRADAGELATLGVSATRLTVAARLLCAPRGLLNDPTPMQPLVLAQAWAAQDAGRREAILVPDVNHYTITLGAAGAGAVAETIASVA